MDFTLSADQHELRALAQRIMTDSTRDGQVGAAEASSERIDRVAWKRLAEAGLLGLGIPEQFGGIGLGLVEICLVLEEQGRCVLPVPLWPTLVLAAAPIARFGSAAQQERWLPGIAAGDLLATGAVTESGANDMSRPAVTATEHHGQWTLTGSKPGVPAGLVADCIVVPAQTGDGPALYLVERSAPGLTMTGAETTNRELHAHLEFAATPADRLGGDTDGAAALRWLHDRAQIGLAAIQLGVAGEALSRTAAYQTVREQFGAPVGSLQGPQLRAADAYIDVETMRCTLAQAAWLLADDRSADWEVRSAKWWAAEAGQRVVHAAQHLHGGIGADIDYPIHRYFLWGKQIENMLGGAPSQLAALGALIAASALAGAER